jgi:hypothetical protein
MEETATTTMHTATQTGTVTAQTVDTMLDISQNSIYLMGASFVLGSLFTLFLLLVLDFVRRGKGEREY